MIGIGLAVLLGVVLALSLVWTGPLSAATQPLATITLLSEAEVVGTVITLGEIAEIDYHLSEEEGKARLDLEEINVGRAPLPGNFRQIAIGHIEVRLRQAGIHPSTVILVPPPEGSVKITTATQEVTKGMVTASVLDCLEEQTGEEFYIDVEVGDVLPLTVPLGRLELRLGTLPLRSGSYRVSVGIYVDGQRHRTIQVRVGLQPRKAGTMIHREDVEKVIPDSSFPGQLFSELEAVVGLEAKRTIRKGAPITLDDVTVSVLIQKGDTVIIEAISGVITVKALGIALQSGKLGDWIQVKNTESQKEITARIVGKGIVCLDLEMGK
jgi:flagella basal body P-ring formation protein FlgA